MQFEWFGLLTADAALLPRLAIALAGGTVLSLAVDRLLRPAGPGLRRELPSALIALGVHGLLFSLALLVFRRPGFACALALSGQMLVVQVSNAKFRALREPFVFTDFGLFSQALRHPRLYLPFLGVGRALTAAALFALAMYVGLALESGSVEAGYGAIVIAAIAIGLLALGSRRAEAMTLDPVADLCRHGLFPTLWLHWLGARRHSAVPLAGPWFGVQQCGQDAPAASLPDVVVVESESFFDVRRLHAAIRPEVLRHFDSVGRESVLRGRLTVPAWGANTMRTEFAFLTGIGEPALGANRFNPYRVAARGPLPALPAYLRSLGYRTVCIHPHPASFFERHRVMPNLGFDQFIDAADFAGAPRTGPYIADRAVADKIAQVLEHAPGPTFVFAITMENHGPLHLERVAQAEQERFYADVPSRGFDDLTVYLRHLVNADDMVWRLRQLLATRSREGVLCFFGDHVPSMPKVYDALGFVDGRSDYLIWRKGGGTAAQRDLRAEELGAVLVDTMLGAGRAA